MTNAATKLNQNVNSELTGRGKQAAITFMEKRGYEILESEYEFANESVDFLAKDEDDTLVFVQVVTTEGMNGFPDMPATDSERTAFEEVAVKYLIEHQYVDVAARKDVINIVVVGENRAFLRHHHNSIN